MPRSGGTSESPLHYPARLGKQSKPVLPGVSARPARWREAILQNDERRSLAGEGPSPINRKRSRYPSSQPDCAQLNRRMKCPHARY